MKGTQDLLAYIKPLFFSAGLVSRIQDGVWLFAIFSFLCSINANGTYKISQPQYSTAYLGKYILEYALNF